MRSLWAIIFLSTLPSFGYSQNNHQVHTDLISGIVAPHYNDMRILRQNPVVGGCIQYNYIPDINSFFELHYKKPEYGAGIEFLNLGNPQMLGNAWAFYLHWGFNPINSNRSKLKIWVAPGVSYVTKIYDTVCNPENTAISNRTNIYFKLASTYSYRIASSWSIAATISITHYSNGATKYPNRGLNQFNAGLGVSYDIAQFSSEENNQDFPFRGFETWLIGTIGKCDSYSTGINSSGVSYLCNTVTAGVAYRYSFFGKAGLSIDGIINRADHHYWDVNWDKMLPVPDQTFFDYFRLGVSVGHEFSYRNLGLLTYAGLYIYNQVKPHDWSYLRTGFRYYMYPVVLNVTLKSVGFKAQYLEFGAGVYLQEIAKTNKKIKRL